MEIYVCRSMYVCLPVSRMERPSHLKGSPVQLALITGVPVPVPVSVSVTVAAHLGPLHFEHSLEFRGKQLRWPTCRLSAVEGHISSE